MYTACLFCHARLGANEVVEHFQVGRRLAFDAAKGRLWVVCKSCAGWNLTPLEERWEAIEECERLFRDTRRRMSTDNIGMAVVPEGLELVRIGAPLRPEFAAWRYGERFGRRRRQSTLAAGASLLVMGAGVAIGLPALSILGPFITAMHITRARFHDWTRAQRTFAHVARSRSGWQEVLRQGNMEVLLSPSDDAQGWGLRIGVGGVMDDYRGSDALRMAAIVLPTENAFGASRSLVQRAVSQLEDASDPSRYFAVALTRARKEGNLYSPIAAYPSEVRIALEMAAQEEAERRTLEGELGLLEQAWREADEIATIADDMFLPSGVDAFLRRHRRD
jgi:hypothetical protein